MKKIMKFLICSILFIRDAHMTPLFNCKKIKEHLETVVIQGNKLDDCKGKDVKFELECRVEEIAKPPDSDKKSLEESKHSTKNKRDEESQFVGEPEEVSPS